MRPQPRLSGSQRYLLLTSCNTPFPFSRLFGQSCGALRAMEEFFHYAGMSRMGRVAFSGAGGKNELPVSVKRKIEHFWSATDLASAAGPMPVSSSCPSRLVRNRSCQRCRAHAGVIELSSAPCPQPIPAAIPSLPVSPCRYRKTAASLRVHARPPSPKVCVCTWDRAAKLSRQAKVKKRARVRCARRSGPFGFNASGI